jgi:hypothetical protein
VLVLSRVSNEVPTPTKKADLDKYVRKRPLLLCPAPARATEQVRLKVSSPLPIAKLVEVDSPRARYTGLHLHAKTPPSADFWSLDSSLLPSHRAGRLPSLKEELPVMSVRTIRNGLILLACLHCPLFCPAQNLKPDFNKLPASHYVFFDVPGATDISPFGINDSLSVTGYYRYQDGSPHGFVRTSNGKLTSFDVGRVDTYPVHINAGGEIAGIYSDVAGFDRSFIRSADGAITTFNPGGSSGSTELTDINVRGTVVGIYTTTNNFPPAQAYLRDRDGAMTAFDIPGSTFVFPESINDLGEITGFYFYENSTQVGGFLRSPGGMVATFDYADGIVPLAINRAGTTIGWYGPATGPEIPFVRAADGVITPYIVPGGMVYTLYMGLNQAGFITGSYTVENTQNPTEPLYLMRAFVRSPHGVISTFVVPGADSTTATGINNLNVVVGWSDSQTHPGGFLRIPDDMPGPCLTP